MSSATSTQTGLPDGHWGKTMTREELARMLAYEYATLLPDGAIYETFVEATRKAGIFNEGMLDYFEKLALRIRIAAEMLEGK